MNRKLLIATAVSVLLALSQTAFGKGHTPAGKAQICTNGNVHNVSDKVVSAFMGASPSGNACILPSCDFNNVFMVGKGNCAGSVDADNDGLCDLPNPRNDAGGVTPGCPAGTY